MLPDIKAVVGHQSQPLLPSLSNDSKLEQAGQKLERRDTKLDGGITLFTPSDVSKVLYPESYDEFMHQRVHVEPVCHCWTPKQSVYVGCSGGQLLMMESDSGVTRLLANPQLIVRKASLQLHYFSIGTCRLMSRLRSMAKSAQRREGESASMNLKSPHKLVMPC